MAARNAKRLFDLEIDEISLVDRSANQHATVAIAKRDEDTMTVMDAQGNLVEVEDLEPGELAFDPETGEFAGVVCEGDAEPEDYGVVVEDGEVFVSDEENELVSVGKAVTGTGGLGKEAFRAARRELPGAARAASRNRAVQAGAAGTALGFGAGKLSKSLGNDVYETLSKALSNDSRNEVISKALEDSRREALVAKRQAAGAIALVQKMQAERELEQLTEITKGYGIGDPAVLAEVLRNLPEDQATYLDQLFSKAGEVLFEELGSGLGDQDATIQDQIEAMAMAAVGKADVSKEQAVTAVYDANPDAYDQYLAENR